MTSYRELYFHMFRAAAQAVEHLEQGQPLLARTCLIRAQQEAEDACLETDILPEQ